MEFDFNFKRVGQTHLYQSDSYLITKDEMIHIFESEYVRNGNIEQMIDDHEMIPLETGVDRRVKYCFWPIPDTDDEWIIDIVKPADANVNLPEKLIDVLKKKKPIPIKTNNNQSNSNAGGKVDSRHKKAKIWITYSWKDNKDQDVDFIAQELNVAGLEVKIDKWKIQAGKRLWEQIENFIQNEDECNAWIFFATINSLGSEACKEEYAYALDRALKSRGNNFPIIGLFQSSVDEEFNTSWN